MKRFLFTCLLFAVAAFQCGAQKFVHDEYLDFYFDNREFDVSGEKYMESETYHSVLLMPEVGLSFKQNKRTEHRIMAGVAVLRDMGSGEKIVDSFKELSVYYRVKHRINKTRSFEAAAGVFPRHLLGGKYTRAIWSDAHGFYDSNMEGVLLKYSTRKLYAEMGCDWMGKYGAATRERFQIFSAGRYKFYSYLSAGWSASFYHYATSAVAHNVIDNHFFNPWVKGDFAGFTGYLQELSLQAGLLAGYQRSREIDDDPVLPVGAEIIMRAKKWNLCLQNSLYAGADLYHYYDYPAPEGGIYSSALYSGENSYRGLYDRVELIWGPRISKKTSLQLTAAFHFDGSGYLGCQQVVRLRTSF